MVYQNQFGYYDALSASEHSDNAEPFVVFMLNIIAYTLGVIVKSKAVPRVLRNLETIALPYAPDFSKIPDKIQITDKIPDKIPDKTQATDKIPDKFAQQLSKGERAFLSSIYVYLCEHGEINNYRAQTLTGKSSDSVRKYFAKLVAIGFLQAVGERKARLYRFADFENEETKA